MNRFFYADLLLRREVMQLFYHREAGLVNYLSKGYILLCQQTKKR